MDFIRSILQVNIILPYCVTSNAHPNSPKDVCTRVNSITVQWAKNGAYNNFNGLIISLQHTGRADRYLESVFELPPLISHLLEIE